MGLGGSPPPVTPSNVMETASNSLKWSVECFRENSPKVGLNIDRKKVADKSGNIDLPEKRKISIL